MLYYQPLHRYINICTVINRYTDTSTYVLLLTVTSTYVLLSTVTLLHQHVMLSTVTPLHQHMSYINHYTVTNNLVFQDSYCTILYGLRWQTF